MKTMTYLLNLTLLVVCTQFVFADGSAEAAAQVKADNYFLEKVLNIEMQNQKKVLEIKELMSLKKVLKILNFHQK